MYMKNIKLKVLLVLCALLLLSAFIAERKDLSLIHIYFEGGNAAATRSIGFTVNLAF